MRKMANKGRLSQREIGKKLQAAQALLDGGRHALAQKAVDRVLKQDPIHLAALELQAKCQWRGGKYQELLKTLSSLCHLNPYEPGYYYLQGAALQCMGQFGEAVKAFARCIEAEGDAPQTSAREAMEALENWQAELVRQLLQDNPRFRTLYAHDPIQACRSMGFEFSGSTSWSAAVESIALAGR